MPLPILYNIANKPAFAQLLQNNPGVVIIKFGAEWCAPCKRIETQVQTYMDAMPDYIQCVMVDIDQSFEVYAFLKSKKMVNGVPVILCYNKGNLNYIPDNAVIGADINKVNLFFQECLA
jgi:thiol:disulfide interchange protein